MTRIASSYQYDSYTASLQDTQLRLRESFDRISTGKRIETISSDPEIADTILSNRALRAHLETSKHNIQVGKQVLGASGEELTRVNELLLSAKQKAIQGATSTLDQSARNQLANEVELFQKRFVEIANTRGIDSQYLFAGTATDPSQDPTPYTVVSNTLVYNGNSRDRIVEVGPNDYRAVNVHLSSTFTQIYGYLESLKNNLRSGNISLIGGTDLQNIDEALTTINQQRGQIGFRLQELNALASDNDRRTFELTKNITENQDVDLAAESERFYRLRQGLLAISSSIHSMMTTQSELMSFITRF
jgi:flagellin-like hook-associated protein FlgL